MAKHGLTFPVGHCADAKAISAATGAFVDPERGFLQSTGFVLDPDGQVVVSVYSSGRSAAWYPTTWSASSATSAITPAATD